MSKRKRADNIPLFQRPMLLAVGLALLNVLVYASVRRFELVNWDDSTYITENPTVLGGLTWSSAWWALTTGHSPYWHPMTWLSHLIDVSLFGTDAGAYHVTNLLIHIANTLLVFDVFRRMTGATGRSAFVAALFAVHPLHVESVAWIAERKDVLSTFFLLLTMRVYLVYVEHPRWTRYALMLVLYGLALMSKPMVVTLPVVLLLLDIWPLGRLVIGGRADLRHERQRPRPQRRTRVIGEKLPLLALALATSVATVIVQHRVGAMAGLAALPWQTRVGNATIGYVAYLWKTIWPTHLAAFYPLFDLSAVRVTLAAATLIAITVLAISARQRHPYVFVGWLWYVVTIAPVIGLLQAGEQGMADRFMYVPMIGLLVIVAWGVPEIVERQTTHGSWLVAIGAIVLVAASAVAAHAQTAHWSDSIALWQHATRVTPNSYIAFENLGQALRETGQLEASRRNYEQALVLAPARSPGYAAVIHNSLGLVLTREGNTRAALDHFAEAAKLNSTFAEAQSNLGNALAAEGRLAEAIEHYELAVRLKPEYTEPRIGLGGALLKGGRVAEAVPHYQEALRLDPNLAQAHNGLGGALAMQGHDDQAMTEYTEALRLKPDLPTAHLNVALLLIKKGDVAQARRHLETALSIDPGYAPAQQALRAITPKA
jgi:tetratricopeptide (TPR) repeat protein